MKKVFFCLATLTLSGPSAHAEKAEIQDMVLRKNADISEQKITPYANMEMRHYTNTYYDHEDYLLKQEPSAHVIGQFGVSLYQGYADLYTTLGVIKMSQTQQIIQRRPQIELDIYPVYNDYFSLTQYTIVETPFSESAFDVRNNNVNFQGSIITLGLAQSLTYKDSNSWTQWSLQFATDVWTKMYSRKQPRDMDESTKETYLLSLTKRNEDPTVLNEESEALPINGEIMAGFSISPNFLQELRIGASVHYNQHQSPWYSYREADDTFTYSYTKETTSHYRVRTSYELSDRISFINDLYHFHEGFFEGRVKGGDQRRLRNIARIQVRL